MHIISQIKKPGWATNYYSKFWNCMIAKWSFKIETFFLFLGNVTCHQEPNQKTLSGIKLEFLPKNPKSRLQLLDVGIIRAFKLKYRKLLIKYRISRVHENKRVPDITKAVDISKFIGWFKSAWREVTSNTIKHCLEKCGFPTDPANICLGEDAWKTSWRLVSSSGEVSKTSLRHLDGNKYICMGHTASSHLQDAFKTS